MVGGVPSDDPLGELLASLRVSATRLSLCEFSAPWGLRSPAFAPCIIYAVLEGGLWIEPAEAAPVFLESGRVLLLTGAGDHVACSGMGTPITPLHEVWADRGLPVWSHRKAADRIVRLSMGGGGVTTRIAFIALEVAEEWGRAFVEGLPPAMLVDGDEGTVARWLGVLVGGLARQKDFSPGHAAISLRLAEIVFLSALSSGLDRRAEMSGWCRALLDRNLARAIAAMQREPGGRWDVASLAKEAGMSRSTFSQRFKDVAGCSPHVFLTDWRMRKAAEMLRSRRLSAKEIGTRLGYANASVFGAAFRQRFGMPPARYREDCGFGQPRTP